MPSTCRAKPALFRGLKPVFTTPQQASATKKIISSACSRPCIYCDIWKLAALIASHSPLSARYNLSTGTPTNSPISSAASSPVSTSPLSRSPTPYCSIIKASKRIDAQFQTQRSQLNSILSICAVAGADAEEGLRMAHDRCASAVEDLLDQEEDLEEELLKNLEDQHYGCHRYNYASQYSHPTSSYSQERRPSMVRVSH
ncbi:hypothetical protein A1O7_09003 [Cladophialophora yegresii CBS 114405]|uniref:Uncharacterized protein n=1 Tax=Cladophialophora yegresii CBS 114405 TaxID=1182544 RepID=W9VK56_9EURO|nr:uncharacterized protein A1O7_09003 [Cladophialophora yegresii CBS 114405]EXJ56072.1 hypothetical protein A1O7_09003 [Cladophialophora yegresii CBS 114405]